MVPTRFFLAVLLVTSAAPGCGGDAASQEPAFSRAQAAFMGHDFDAAEAAYREVLQTDTVAAHRTEAGAVLAGMAWRLRHDTATAAGLLRELEASGPGRYRARMERARMLAAHHAWGPAGEAAAAAVQPAEDAGGRDRARTARAATVIEPALRARLGRPGGAAVDSGTLAAAVAELRELVRAAPGVLEPARWLVLGGVLLHDGPAVLEGWTSYYLVSTGDTARGPLAEPRRTLSALLPAWTGQAAQRTALVHALADSRFFDAAAALALEPAGGAAPADPRAAELVAYAEFLYDAAELTDEYYRQTALGRGDHRAWRRELRELGRALWPRLAWEGAPPRYSEERAREEADRRFGAVVIAGETAGYEDMHYGHRVVDEQRTVRQYGHQAAVRFVSLDAMASNGFQSWAWDGRAAHGGWQNENGIVQVRPGYVDEPRQAWAAVTDTAAVRRGAAELARDSAADAARALAAPVAYFPSVLARMQRDDGRALLDSLRGAGLAGPALEAAFQRIVGEAVQESSIFAHEGRHAIDQTLGRFSTEELEYRAKLSQVVFAPRPRLALAGTMDANVGDRTPHGRANARVLRGILEWMQAHAAEVAGLDPSAPLLPQLPLLSDAQLREAVASLDPLADGAAPPGPEG
ncbi:MAG TPA: hypothetical protein VF006_06845 [Longimicrobium sp.]